MNYTPQGHIQIMDWPTLQEAIRKEPDKYVTFMRDAKGMPIGHANLDANSCTLMGAWLKFEVETLANFKMVKPMPEVLNN